MRRYYVRLGDGSTEVRDGTVVVWDPSGHDQTHLLVVGRVRITEEGEIRVLGNDGEVYTLDLPGGRVRAVLQS